MKPLLFCLFAVMPAAAAPRALMSGSSQNPISPPIPGSQPTASSPISYAPTNTEGQVEFSADVYILKPNRGGKGLLGMFNYATQADEGVGNGFLLRIDFRAEFFNIFNRAVVPNPATNAKLTTLYNPATGAPTQGFGRIDPNQAQVGTPRSRQVALRVNF